MDPSIADPEASRPRTRNAAPVVERGFRRGGRADATAVSAGVQAIDGIGKRLSPWFIFQPGNGKAMGRHP